MTIEIALVGPEYHEALTAPIRTAFGMRFDPERAARQKRLPELVQRIAAFDEGKIIGSAGGFDFEMTTPGGAALVAGLTMVAVLPTHRRRGVLTRMMRQHIDDARARGLSMSALWATEESIYGRFGYGIASLSTSVSVHRGHTAMKRPVPENGVFRLLEVEEAIEPCRSVWERVRPLTPCMMSRSKEWWEYRRLGDFDKSAAPLMRVVLFVDGQPEGYAIYRHSERILVPGPIETVIEIVEAVATTPAATAMVWRYLLDIDLARRFDVPLLHPAHPLFHLLREPRRLSATDADAIWVRLIDVEAALAKRAYPARGEVTFRLDDAFCPWNEGVYRLGEGGAHRTSSAPELRFDATALGSMYIGYVTARQLADAGEIDELVPGAVERADALFRWSRAPWCPDVF